MLTSALILWEPPPPLLPKRAPGWTADPGKEGFEQRPKWQFDLAPHTALLTASITNSLRSHLFPVVDVWPQVFVLLKRREILTDTSLNFRKPRSKLAPS